MKRQAIFALLSSGLILCAASASAQTRDPYERNNEFNTCSPGSMDPRCYVAQGRGFDERNNEFNTCTPGTMDPRCYVAQDRRFDDRNNEFNTCTPGNMDPRCYSASGGGGYDPDRDYIFYYDDQE